MPPTTTFDAGVVLRLDTEEAKKKLNQLKEELGRQEKTRASTEAKVKRDERDIGGGSTARGTNATGKVVDKMVDAAFKRATTRNPMSQLAQTIIGGKFGQAFASDIGAAGATALKVAGTVAAVYGVASMGAKTAVPVLEFMKGALPDVLSNSAPFKALETALNALKGSFNALESGVTSLFTAMGKTKDVATAGMQVTGQIPNLAYLYSQNLQLDTAESRLKKKFDEFKSRGVAYTLGSEMKSVFKGAFSR